jgi:hypothetical protein
VTGKTKLALTWLDVLAIVLVLFCGIGAWTAAAGAATVYLAQDQPRASSYQAKHGIARLQAELAFTIRELSATESRLFARRLDLLAIEAATAPVAASASAAAPVTPAAPLSAQAAPPVTPQIVDALAKRQAALAQTANRQSGRLAAAKETADEEFRHATQWWRWRNHGIVFASALSGTLVALLVLWGLFTLVSMATGLWSQAALVAGVALPLLAITLGYHIGSFIGASLVAIVLLLIVGLVRGGHAMGTTAATTAAPRGAPHV